MMDGMRSTPETRISLKRYMRQEFNNKPLQVLNVLFHQWTGIPSLERATLTNGYQAWVVLPDLVANWAYLRGDFELEVTDFIDTVAAPGMLALDIGAQFGLKSAFLHEAVGKDGKVIAFEPIPSTYKVLKRNSDNWGMEAYQLALSQRSGMSDMHDFGPRNAGQNTLKTPHYTHELKAGKVVSVQTTTVDRFVQEHDLKTDLWKIDVENAEYDVLLGGKNTISTQKPEIIMEIGDAGRAPGEQTKDLLDLLSQYGYQFYEIVKGVFGQIKDGTPHPKTQNLLASQRHF